MARKSAPKKGARHGQRRTTRPERGTSRVDRPRAQESRRNGTTPPAPAPASDRELRNRHLRSAVAEAARLVCRLNGAMLVEVAPFTQHFLDDDDIDRRIKHGDPVASLDAIAFAMHELSIVSRWLEAHIAIRGDG